MAVVLKSPADIEAMKEAGRLSAMVLREVGKRCVPGVSTLELDQFAEDFIRLHGGVPAFKHYVGNGRYVKGEGFPGTICASLNDTIVHGIPSADIILQEGDIISIDTGAIVDGWVGDNAWTYAVGEISPAKKRLLEVTERSMWAGLDAAVAGNDMQDIGRAVSKVAAGYGVVREYTGHGVGRIMHEDPSVANWVAPWCKGRLKVGMVLAIEPMVNLGTYKTRQMADGWTVKTKDGKPSAHFEKTVAITETGPLVLTTEPDHIRPI